MADKSPYPSRVFCGWNGPIAEEAAGAFVSLLAAAGEWRKGQPADLNRHLLLVPTKLAARLLGEALAKLAKADLDSGLMLPRIETPEQFLNWGDSRLNVASPADELMSWIKVLTSTNRNELQALFPAAAERAEPGTRFTFDEAKKFGEQLNELRNQLGAAGHSFGSVVSTHEPGRWAQLAKLEQGFLDNLRDVRGLIDHNQLRADLANDPQGGPDGVDHIWVIGVPDPDPLLLRALDNLKASIGTTFMVGADAAVAEGFDAQGRPVPRFWKDREVDWPDFERCVHLASDPNDGFLKLRRLLGGKPPQAGTVAICACDRQEDSPKVENLIQELGGTAINPLGRAHGEHPIHQALRAWADCLAGEGLDFQALRHATTIPMVHDFITGGDKAEHFTESNQLLDMLDQDLLRMPAEKLVAWLPTRTADDDRAGSRIRQTNKAVPYLKRAVAKRASHLAMGWRAALGTALEELIGPKGIDWQDEADAFTGEVAEHLESIAEGLEAALVAQGLELNASQAIHLTLETAGEKRHRPKRDTQSLNIPGWIESTWEPVPHLILLGLNDHVIPKAPHAHPFLPGKLREALGLPNGETIFATACYHLEQLWRRRAGKGRLDIIVLQKDEDSEPLRPSRILFTGSNAALPAKVAKLFEDAPESEAKPYWEIPKAHKLIPLADPAKVAAKKAKMHATSFAAYLESPENFWLSKVLGLSEDEHDGGELDASGFGNLIHAVMEAFAKPQLGKDRSTESESNLVEELRKDFRRLLAEQIHAKFGDEPEESVLLQQRTALARLDSFAPLQAKLWAEGWVIHSVEAWLKDRDIGGMLVGGRYDRLDYKVVGKAKHWRVYDYKTSKEPKGIETAHYGKPPEGAQDFLFTPPGSKGGPQRWRNLQIPVYYECLQYELQLDEDNILTPCYICLPQDTSKTKIDEWDKYPELHGEALKVLKQVVLEIRSIGPGRIQPSADTAEYPAIPTMAKRNLGTYLRTELLGS